MARKRNDRKTQRREDAEKRQEAYDALPLAEKQARNPNKEIT